MKLKEKIEINFVCPICGKKDFYYKFSGKDCWYHTNTDKEYDVVECRHCLLEFIYPQPSIEEQKSFYPMDYYSYVINGKFLSGFRKLIANIGQRLGKLFDHKKLNLPIQKGNGKSFLDIGCGAGENLDLMQQKGWDVRGFEIGDKVEYKNNIYYGPSIIEVNFSEKYDYIRCHHVFEHVYNPVEFLGKCHSILKDDGIMVFGLPNVNSFSSNLFGKYAVDRDIPRHLFGYNYENIQTMFKNNGFKIIYKNYQQNYGSLQSFSRYIYDKYGKDVSNNFLLKGIFILFDIVLSLFKPTNSMGFVLKRKKEKEFYA